jgi:uncharacterized protein YukJ
MPLQGYGLLIGRVTGARPPRKGSAHWVLFVQPGDPKHPSYRVAVNFQNTHHRGPSEAQYQIVNFSGRGPGAALMREIRALGEPKNFLAADSRSDIPRLDFVRDEILNLNKFKDLRVGDTTLEKSFGAALTNAQKSGSDTLVAVFGTGYPLDPDTGQSVPTGYTGIENIHMNQGAMNLINNPPHYHENAPGQDGGIIFYSASMAQGYFVKFATQTVETRDDGHPAVTGVKEIDNVSRAIRKAIMPPMPKPSERYALMATSHASASKKKTKVARAPLKSGATNSSGYVFADFDPQDATGQWIADKDDNYLTPFVQSWGKGKVKGPVPSPKSYPTMDLSSVVGNTPPGYSKNTGTQQIAFDIMGDSGGATSEKLEQSVTDLLSAYAQKSPPAFLFHVGDVVYYYGEQDYYYGQFYEPFRAYPAPIFAIPGNHDGVIYNTKMQSLDAFQKAFCAPSPQNWPGSGGIRRTSMTQPGVYFTLDALLVSIIGLYSNCGESFGYLDQQQLVFLYKELVRLKALRAKDNRAVILAIHHFPRWFPAAPGKKKQKDPTSDAIDAACAKAGFWPDAVICGHAHLYQRVVRPNGNQHIPYIMAGDGGYGLKANEELGKDYMADVVKGNTKMGFVRVEGGFVRATVSQPAKGDPTLTFNFHSVKQTGTQPEDSCVLNLRTRQVV